MLLQGGNSMRAEEGKRIKKCWICKIVSLIIHLVPVLNYALDMPSLTSDDDDKR